MKHLAVLFFALVLTQVNAQKDEWKKNYQSKWENFEGGTRLLTTNNNPLPVTYVID